MKYSNTKAYVEEVRNNFSEKLREIFKNNLNYYIQKKNSLGFSDVMSAIASTENYDIADLYKLLQQSAEEIDDYKLYNIYFSIDEIPEEKKKFYKTRPFFDISINDPVLIIYNNSDNLLDKQSNNANISLLTKLFNEILSTALKHNASDIHIVPKNNYHVYFRENGMFMLQNQFTMPLDKGNSLIDVIMREAANYTKGDYQPNVKLKAQDARIDTVIDDLPITLRINIAPSGWNESLVDVTMRIIRRKNSIIVDLSKPIEQALLDYGVLQEDIPVIKTINELKGGIIVISGITNSGKSTFVNTILNYINGQKIGSIEDPVEYYLPKSEYVQHQLFQAYNEELRMEFTDYVKAFKRGDYDIVFIGEWRRSNDLTQAIIEQAYAGQLVFTTLHINSSFSIYTALRDMYGVNPSSIKNILILSWNQTLLPKLCPYCSHHHEEYRYSDEDIIQISLRSDEVADSIRGSAFSNVRERNKKGCRHCNFSGIIGRVPIYDYFINPPTIEQYDAYYIKHEQSIKKKLKTDVFFKRLQEGLVDPRAIYKIL